MNEATDRELLKRFQESESDDAFATLVQRHIHLVYSAAHRGTTNPHHAEEISQAVFVTLARKAKSLPSETILAGWLYQTARLTTANFLRAEKRRIQREQIAFMQPIHEGTSTEIQWQDFAPALEDAMGHLSATDRDALVLRHFENKSLAEVGTELGIGERAAQKRVHRAIEKLRQFFGRRGLAATATVIAAKLSAHSVQAAPVGLAITISATAIKGSAVAVSTLTLVKETIKTMTWLKTKTSLALATGLLLVAGGGIATAYHGRPHGDQDRSAEAQAKFRAEQKGGRENVATDPNAQKHRDEQAALAEGK